MTSEFKEFYAAAQFVKYDHIPIFTTDNLEVYFLFFLFDCPSILKKIYFSSNKKVIISVEFQYFLIKEDLKLLHDSYDIRYQSIIVNNAKDALKVKKFRKCWGLILCQKGHTNTSDSFKSLKTRVLNSVPKLQSLSC